MSSTPESSSLGKGAGWSSALKHVLLLFERGLYGPVALMLPLSMRFRVPRKMSTMLEHRGDKPVSSSPCFLSLCWGQQCPMEGWLIRLDLEKWERSTAYLWHTAWKIYVQAIFFSCCNSIFLIDTINLPSIRNKTHDWLPTLSDFRKRRRAMGCINKAKRRNSGKKSHGITVNSRLLQKMGLGERGKSHYEMVCPGVMPSRKIKNRYQCTDCHMCQELFMLSFPPILIAIL